MRSLRRNPATWGAFVAAATFVLGYLGYRSAEGPALARDDALFRTFQLFALDGQFDDEVPWQLNTARFLAPILIVSATLLVLMSFLRDQFSRAWIALTFRHHVVVVGVNSTTSLIATALRGGGRQVVAIDADATNAHLPTMRAEGVRVEVGDARQAVVQHRAKVERARDIVIDTGDDTQNLEIADHVIEGSSSDSRATLHVAIDDPALWLELARLTAGGRRTGVVVEWYNRTDRQALHLLEEAERALDAALQADEAAYVDCDGDLARRVVTHLVRRNALSTQHLEVITSRSTSSAVADLLQHEGWQYSDIDLPLVERLPAHASVALVHRQASDAQAISRALELTRESPAVHVFVAVGGQISDAVLAVGGTSDRVHLVTVSAAAVASGFTVRSAIELMAQARHQHYLDQERAKGATPDTNPSLTAWITLPEALKQQNRSFARSIGRLLDELNAEIRPLRGAAAPGDLDLPDAVLERLAISEHQRWTQSLVEDGWRFAPGPKDPHAKTHPLLVDWDVLSEADRQKDRDAIQAVPRMLARLGYALTLPHQLSGGSR